MGLDMSIKLSKALLAILLPIASTSIAQGSTYGPQLEGFEYPHEVNRFGFVSQGQPLSMAYLDVAPANPNNRTAVLLHGKNFCAATWESAIAALVAAGYRVIAPDQVGFCKSSKPPAYQFSFGQLAFNTHALLEKLGIQNASIVGHSWRMLAVALCPAISKHRNSVAAIHRRRTGRPRVFLASVALAFRELIPIRRIRSTSGLFLRGQWKPVSAGSTC